MIPLIDYRIDQLKLSKERAIYNRLLGYEIFQNWLYTEILCMQLTTEFSVHLSKKDVLMLETSLNTYCIAFSLLIIIFKARNKISFTNLFEKCSTMVAQYHF